MAYMNEDYVSRHDVWYEANVLKPQGGSTKPHKGLKGAKLLSFQSRRIASSGFNCL